MAKIRIRDIIHYIDNLLEHHGATLRNTLRTRAGIMMVNGTAHHFEDAYDLAMRQYMGESPIAESVKQLSVQEKQTLLLQMAADDKDNFPAGYFLKKKLAFSALQFTPREISTPYGEAEEPLINTLLANPKTRDPEFAELVLQAGCSINPNTHDIIEGAASRLGEEPARKFKQLMTDAMVIGAARQRKEAKEHKAPIRAESQLAPGPKQQQLLVKQPPTRRL